MFHRDFVGGFSRFALSARRDPGKAQREQRAQQHR